MYRVSFCPFVPWSFYLLMPDTYRFLFIPPRQISHHHDQPCQRLRLVGK
jgi:hypothetical protein